MQIEGASALRRCPACGGPAVREVTDGVQGNRLVWSEEIHCRDCPHHEVACGAGDLPAPLRAELLARYGATTIRLDPAEARPLRVRLLSVLRAHGGAPIAAAATEYDRLTREGVTGTGGEMRLLADRLTTTGVRVHVEPPAPPQRRTSTPACGARPDRKGGEVRENVPVLDHRLCRLVVSGGELELAGPPAALRALGELLRRPAETLVVAITGGSVVQEVTGGPLLIGLEDGGTTLRVSGGREYLGLFWNALDGVAEQAETADDRGVNRHQHIEYLPGDEYRSPHSIPLVVAADWPGEHTPATD